MDQEPGNIIPLLYHNRLNQKNFVKRIVTQEANHFLVLFRALLSDNSAAS